MKKSIMAISVVILLLSINVFAVDVSETKSIKALRMEKFPNLETIEIQLEVKKIFLSEIDNTPEPVPTAEDKKNGYILFFRNYLKTVYPFTKPTKEEIAKKEIKIFATLGEFEPITFSVYPLVKLTNCKILVSDFVNEKGDKITKDAFQINDVINCPIGSEMIVVRAYILYPAKEVPVIEEGVCKQIWINVKVPEDAKEGVYKGTVQFAPSGRPVVNIPVELRVLPFKLMQPPDVTWAPCWGHGGRDFDRLEQRLTLLKEHGMTGEAVDGVLSPEGNDFTKANKYMEIAKKVGLTGKFVIIDTHIQGTSKYDTTYGPFGLMGDQLFCQSTYDKLVDFMTRIRDNAEKNKWLPYVFYLTTELGYTGASGEESFNKTMEKAVEWYKAARKVERVKLLATFNRESEFIMHWNLPELDEIGMNGEMFSEWEKAAKIKPSWICFVGMNDRCGEGFYMWKFNIKGNRPWLGGETINTGNREEILMKDYNKRWCATTRFEKIREGVDDYKYCYTLSEYIKQAKAKGKDTSSAEVTLKNIIDKIPHDHKNKPDSDWVVNKYDFTKLDEYRWQIAQEILKILK